MLYEVITPTHIKRIAKADAEAYRILSEAIEQSPIIPSVIKDGKLSMDASDCDVISIRIKERVAFQEFKKQVNIENVISKAYCQLKDEEKVSSDSVDDVITSYSIHYTKLYDVRVAARAIGRSWLSRRFHRASTGPRGHRRGLRRRGCLRGRPLRRFRRR